MGFLLGSLLKLNCNLQHLCLYSPGFQFFFVNKTVSLELLADLRSFQKQTGFELAYTATVPDNVYLDVAFL
jgi:hypothetical protein